MAKLYVDVLGVPIRYLRTEQQEELHPNPPSGTVETLEFDIRTNPDIDTKLCADQKLCRVSGGQFIWNGVVQSINAPSNELTDRTALKVIWLKLKSDQIVTAAEVRLILRYLLRRVLQD